MAIIAYGIISLMLFSMNATGQVNETFESVVKSGISRGIIKKDGYKVTYIAAPATDTAKIRIYYEDLIRKTGKPYEFSFESNAKVLPPANKNYDNLNTIVVENKNDIKNGLIIPPTTSGTPGNPITPGEGGCWTRQRVFGELHFTERVEEYTFTVPSDVTSIKIEAWSGGGNGYGQIVTRVRTARDITQRLLESISGRGGGGGAYACGIIPVKKGDRVIMSIPPAGGGKSVHVKLNGNENMFYLNNGGDGNPGALFGDGQGGLSGGTYGVFKNNLYWMGGANGESYEASEYGIAYGNDGDGMVIQATYTVENYIINFGKGGNAALLNNGGLPARYSTYITNPQVAATNGQFPGGGGGGGDANYLPNAKPGKGAPGMVIIHY